MKAPLFLLAAALGCASATEPPDPPEPPEPDPVACVVNAETLASIGAVLRCADWSYDSDGNAVLG